MSDRLCDPCLRTCLEGCTTGTEHWLPHPDHPGYHVSNLGAVRGPKGLLKPYLNDGYFRVDIASRHRKLHHLVLEVYIGERVEGEIGLHYNDMAWDNTIMNLRWGDPAANAADRERNRRLKAPRCVLDGCDQPARYHDPGATCRIHYAMWRRQVANRALELASAMA